MQIGYSWSSLWEGICDDDADNDDDDDDSGKFAPGFNP
jgi:hypothetical protein